MDCTGGPQTGCSQAGGPGGGFLANGGIKPNSTVTVPSVADLRAGTGGYVPNQTRPEAVQWNIGFQQVFWNDYTFESNYIGTHGVYLPVQIQLNRQPVVNASNALPLVLQHAEPGDPRLLDEHAFRSSGAEISRRQHYSGLPCRGFHRDHHVLPALG